MEILAHLCKILEKITVPEEKVSRIETHLGAMAPQVERPHHVCKWRLLHGEEAVGVHCQRVL